MDVVTSSKPHSSARDRDKQKAVAYALAPVQLIAGFFDLSDVCSILYT